MIVQHCHAVPHTRCRSQFWKHCGKATGTPLSSWMVAHPAHKVERALELVGCDNLLVIRAGFPLVLEFVPSFWLGFGPSRTPQVPHKTHTVPVLCCA